MQAAEELLLLGSAALEAPQDPQPWLALAKAFAAQRKVDAAFLMYLHAAALANACRDSPTVRAPSLLRASSDPPCAQLTIPWCQPTDKLRAHASLGTVRLNAAGAGPAE